MGVDPLYYKTRSDGGLVFQHDTPQLDWARVLKSLSSVDPTSQLPSRKRQYQDVIKGLKLDRPLPSRAASPVFSDEQQQHIEQMLRNQRVSICEELLAELSEIRDELARLKARVSDTDFLLDYEPDYETWK